MLFADDLPEQWGNIGRAMLTFFVMLTLEDFPVYMADAMEIHPWAWLYFVSFILLAAFIVINVLISVVLNSMEEARELERREAIRARHPGRAVSPPSIPRPTRTSPSASRSCGAPSTSSSWSSRSTARRRTSEGKAFGVRLQPDPAACRHAHPSRSSWRR